MLSTELTSTNPDILATACPLCKKTFAAVTKTKVADIAEIVADALVSGSIKKDSSHINSVKELANI